MDFTARGGSAIGSRLKGTVVAAMQFAGPGLAVALGWKAALRVLQVLEAGAFHPFNGQNLLAGLPRLGAILPLMGASFASLDHWSLLWFAAPVALITLEWQRRMEALWLGLALFAPLAFDLIPYLFTTLDVVSGGRVEFGIGASWLQAEWEAVGLDFASRGRRVDEAIEVCRRLWSETVVEHHGEFFDFAPVMFNPKPVQQPQPSLLIGGDGKAAKRRAALVGDGWLPMNHSLEQLPGALAEINQMRADAGREGTTTLTVGGGIDTPADVDRYRDANVDRVVVRPFTTSRDARTSSRRPFTE